MTKKRVSLFFFHPFPRRSKANRVLFDAIRERCPEVRAYDVYERYADFSIDAKREQELLLDSDVIAFQHPVYWYSCPALMKEWLDEVLEKGWAYGPGGDRLRGKSWLQLLTVGGQDEAYHRGGLNEFSMAELLRPFEATAHLCGMSILRPFIVYNVQNQTEASLLDAVQGAVTLLNGLAAGREASPYSTLSAPEVRFS